MITFMCILQSVSSGTTRFGSGDLRACVGPKLMKLPWCFLSDSNSQYPTLWTEQVRSRQNNRTRAQSEFQRPLFYLMMASGCCRPQLKARCVFPACVSNHGLRLFLSFKDRWWVVKPVHLSVGVRQALRICFSVVLLIAAFL